ncbi:MAG: HAD-IA family hydrolase [Nitrososphaeraceae archaeon]|nr:HAD-IA family hydrolase [Nitrososphaeraceae archaeon]
MVSALDLRLLNSAECALFDIDGVLIDVRKSYNLAIKQTVDFVVKRMTGASCARRLVSDTLLLKFKQTGGFNNEIDMSYAIILALMSLPFGESVHDKTDFLFTVAENADETGMLSVEEYLSSLYPASRIKKLKEDLVYPAPVGKSLLATVFDELFYGPTLFQKQHNLKPMYYHGKPLIENDKIVIREKTIRLFSKKFRENLALISGRSQIAAQHSLKPIFNIFNSSASVFLEDENREHWKPNPYSLKKAMKHLGAKTALYVGDSIEDLNMARKAETETDVKILFIGVYGCSVRPQEMIRKFKDNHADFIIKNVNCLYKK